MKKNIFIISLLAVFILGSFTFAFASLLPQRDNVQFSQTVLFGDPKAAEGLTLNYRNHYDYHLFWDTTWTIGTPPESAVTDYRFTSSEDRESPHAEPAITLDPHNFKEYNMDGQVNGLQKAFDELAETAKPDKENIRVIYIADYYQYYPIQVNLGLPASEPADTQKYFQEFFKIPVLPDDTMEIQLWLNSSGGISSTRTGYGTDTLLYMYTESAAADDVCYFTFTTSAQNHQYIDTSLIPGGFGIYALPYSENGIEAENLSMVYPLNPKAQAISMELNSSQTSLFLFTKEADGFYFTEIALDGMETLQRLRINDPNTIYTDMLHIADDYFAFYGADNNDVSGYRIFSRDESGQFKFEFLIPSPIDEGRDYFNFYSEATFAYDGERAALTGLPVSTTHWSSAFTVAVYDETGMLYAGEYNTGQNCRESSQGNYNCQPQNNHMAEISWN